MALSSEFELLPLEGATSPVWEYFGFRAIDGKYVIKVKKERKNVYCKICKTVHNDEQLPAMYVLYNNYLVC